MDDVDHHVLRRRIDVLGLAMIWVSGSITALSASITLRLRPTISVWLSVEVMNPALGHEVDGTRQNAAQLLDLMAERLGVPELFLNATSSVSAAARAMPTSTTAAANAIAASDEDDDVIPPREDAPQLARRPQSLFKISPRYMPSGYPARRR